jgi:hypothetical protein
VLHRFTGGSDGCAPFAGLNGRNGVLFGTTEGIYCSSNGTLFKLVPPAPGSHRWIERTLHAFNGSDGGDPEARLTHDPLGGLFSTTSAGGTFSKGTVFMVVP